MVTPRTALKAFAQLEEERKSDAVLRYQLKVAVRIGAARGADTRRIAEEADRLRDSRPDLFLEAIKDAGGAGFPTELFIESGFRVRFDHLALGAQATEPFKAFLRAGSASGLPGVGLVFPVLGRGDWIIHNLPIRPLPGKVRLVVPAAGELMNNVHITTLNQYLQESAR